MRFVRKLCAMLNIHSGVRICFNRRIIGWRAVSPLLAAGEGSGAFLAEITILASQQTTPFAATSLEGISPRICFQTMLS